MRVYPRIVPLLLAWLTSGWLFSGCYGGPGVEPPLSSTTDNEVPSGPVGNGFSPAIGEAGGRPVSHGEDEDEAPESNVHDDETWSDQRKDPPPVGYDTGGLAPSVTSGDAGLPPDAGDGGEGRVDAGGCVPRVRPMVPVARTAASDGFKTRPFSNKIPVR